MPESIETDGTLVWRILMNYVTNALKAAVRPGAEQGRGVDVRISRVRANATGISPAQDCATLLCRAGAIAAAKRGALANEEIATDVVGLAPTARPEEWLKIEVEDSGPGVDAALRHRLFNAFVQAQGTKEGTGLGCLPSNSVLLCIRRVWRALQEQRATNQEGQDGHVRAEI